MAVAVAEVVAAVASRKTDEGVRMGLELEALRRERGLTQQEVADRLPMSLEGYRNYAKGYGRISRNTLPKWARALDIPAPELAKRLGIELLAEPDASALRQQLATLLPDANAAELDDLARKLATLSPFDQKQILDGWRDYLTGRIARLGRA